MSATAGDNTRTRPLEAIILAAGKGTRMNSDLPKVMHPVAGRPMLSWVVDACEAVGCRRIVIVIGHGGEQIRRDFADRRSCAFVEQAEQLGTGHAVMQAAPLYENLSKETDVLVLCGDGPLIRASTLETMLKVHRRADADATLATSVIDDPAGYGRIVRDHSGRFLRIVEHKDASADELQVHEINPSYYCFRAAALFDVLAKVSNDNAKGEYYLTDVFSLLVERGRPVEVVDAVPPREVLSINTPAQLAEVDAMLRQQLNEPRAGRKAEVTG